NGSSGDPTKSLVTKAALPIPQRTAHSLFLCATSDPDRGVGGSVFQDNYIVVLDGAGGVREIAVQPFQDRSDTGVATAGGIAGLRSAHVDGGPTDFRAAVVHGKIPGA